MKTLLERIQDTQASAVATGADPAIRDKLARAPRHELDQVARELGIQPVGLRRDQVVDRVVEALEP